LSSVNPHTSRCLLAVALALTLVSCSSGGYVATPSMPAARAALRPEYRLFYDALIDYGDWVLIEPYGFVFRPRVDFATFRPYEDGFWAPSDPWGWVWISAEPFGWATYHYGSWTWDRFQGWVWLPGLDWAPAWVSWEIAGSFAGWAPVTPGSGGPGNGYLYAPLERMGSTDLSAHMVTRAQLGDAAASAEPVAAVVEQDGVQFNPGPPFTLVERARGGSLPRVKIEQPASLARPAEPRGAPGDGAPATPDPEAVRQAAASAARQAHALIERGGAPPPQLSLPRPSGLKPAEGEPPAAKAPPPKPAKPGARGSAARDTTR
jgi:hypothetical protein